MGHRMEVYLSPEAAEKVCHGPGTRCRRPPPLDPSTDAAGCAPRGWRRDRADRNAWRVPPPPASNPPPSAGDRHRAGVQRGRPDRRPRGGGPCRPGGGVINRWNMHAVEFQSTVHAHQNGGGMIVRIGFTLCHGSSRHCKVVVHSVPETHKDPPVAQGAGHVYPVYPVFHRTALF